MTTTTRSNHNSPAHTNADTPAGKFLRRFWQPVHLSAKLKNGWTAPIRIMGQNFTLYRGETGVPHLIGPRCAHRGVQLSAGIIVGDTLRCPYHAWTYESSGQCIAQPAEQHPFCETIRIPSYPVQEYLGFIWAYFGAGDPPEMPYYPFLEQPGLTITDEITFNFNYFHHLENAIDETHLSFLHAVSPYAAVSEVPIISAEETDFGLAQYGKRPSTGIRRETYYHMPNATSWSQPSMYPEETAWRSFVAYRVPIDDTEHHIFHVCHYAVEAANVESLRTKLMAAWEDLRKLRPAFEVADDILDGRLRWADLPVRGSGADMAIVQDQVAQFGQGVIANRTDEHLGQADAAIVLLRSILDREFSALERGLPLKHWTRTIPRPSSGV
jgi:5,5'-dehydrodivanillate O-demethylase